MNQEIINKIEVRSGRELFVGLASKGDIMYQYVYRESSGVYWDKTNKGFRSTEMKEWSHSKWFFHIVKVVKSGLGVELQLSSKVNWDKIPDREKNIIKLDMMGSLRKTI